MGNFYSLSCRIFSIPIISAATHHPKGGKEGMTRQKEENQENGKCVHSNLNLNLILMYE